MTTSINPLPEEARPHWQLGEEFLFKQSYARARKEYLKALNMAPAYAPLYVRLGETFFYSKKKNLPEALRCYRRAIDLSPKWGEGHYACGTACEEMGQLDAALDAYETASKLAPNDARPLTTSGRCLIRLRRFTAAVHVLRKALSLKPHYGEASVHLWLADALRQSGQTQAACNEWKTVLELPPSYPDYEAPKREARELLNKYCEARKQGQGRRRSTHKKT